MTDLEKVFKVQISDRQLCNQRYTSCMTVIRYLFWGIQYPYFPFLKPVTSKLWEYSCKQMIVFFVHVAPYVAPGQSWLIYMIIYIKKEYTEYDGLNYLHRVISSQKCVFTHTWLSSFDTQLMIIWILILQN